MAVADAGMALELLDGGLVAGIAINAPCSRGNVAASGGVQLPSSQALQLRVPLAAPDVLQLLASSQQAPLPGGAAAGVHPSDPVAQQGQGAGQDQQAEAQQKKGQAGKPKAKEEEKTWLQKNWMIMMPLGFIVRLLLGFSVLLLCPRASHSCACLPARSAAALCIVGHTCCVLTDCLAGSQPLLT